MSLTYRLPRIGEAKPPCDTQTYMIRRDVMAVWKDASNFQPRRYTENVWTRYDWKFKIVSLKRRLSIQMASKALATSRKTATVSLFSANFLIILSTRRVNCKDVLCLDRNRTA